MKVLVSGYLIRKPVAGLAYHYLQYVIGLEKMGHEVFYIEDGEDVAGDLQANLAFTRDTFRYFGLGPSWAIYDFGLREWLGEGAGGVSRFISDADLLINVSGSLAVLDWFQHIPRRVFIDTDPVFTQAKSVSYPAWAARCAAHTHFMSFGENYGRPECTMPVDGFPWTPTRQPMINAHWDFANTPGCRYTTVMSWKSYNPVSADNKVYGVKDQSYSLIRELPESCPGLLEIALDAQDEVHQMLADDGWVTVPAAGISQRVEDYRNYIVASRGEFSLAKSAYVETCSGWFSERSACYLAAGRPVITQDTGFSTWMDVDRGVLRFSTREEARECIQQLESDYVVHSAAAREIAREYFDFEKVLGELLQRVSSEAPGAVATGSGASTCLDHYRQVIGQVLERVPDGASFLLIDDRQFGVFGELDGRRVVPFLEKGGQYWGKPVDSEHAIAEFKKMKAEGKAERIVVTGEGSWWLDYYPEFFDYLSRHYTLEEPGFAMRYYEAQPADTAGF